MFSSNRRKQITQAWVLSETSACRANEPSVNSITLGDELSSSLIKGVSFGVLRPGVDAVKTLYLFNSGTPGNRMIDISVRSISTSGSLAASSTPNDLVDATETLQTMVVPTVEPVAVAFDVVYRRALGSRRGLADLGTFEETFWDDGDGGEAIVDMRLECAGPWGLEVTDVRLVKEVRPFSGSCSHLAHEILPGWKARKGSRKLSGMRTRRYVSRWFVICQFIHLILC
jgi:hypothetical protein